MSAFSALPVRPPEHFALHFYGAVLAVRARLGDAAPAFLAAYEPDLAAGGIDDPARWWEAVARWESGARGHLPLRALREAAGLGVHDLEGLFVAGLPEEDARFGPLLDVLHDGGRPGARLALRRFRELGLLIAADGALRVDPGLWDLLRGDVPRFPAAWAEHRATAELSRDGLIVDAGPARAIDALPALVAAGAVTCVVVRGPAGSGRRTLAAALARACGRGVVAATEPLAGQDPRWTSLAVMAALLDALPLAPVETAPGELLEVPQPPVAVGPLLLTAGRRGTVGGAGAAGALTLELDVPDAATRLAHWLAGAEGRPLADADRVAGSQRLGAGTIRSLARLAGIEATLDGREAITGEDVARARRRLDAGRLDALATRVEASGTWDDLAVDAETADELHWLEQRCRSRERLAGGPGVRVLFSGPSGTGKTLAARLLAAVLGMDL